MKMDKWMKKNAPLGIAVETEKGVYITGLITAIIWSMWFLILYMDQRNTLYEVRDGRRKLIEGAMMCSFDELMEYRFLLFQVLILSMAFLVIYHYFYHYQGSHMMYLMKRLPDRMELHRRCTVLPIMGGLIAVVIMVILWLIYYGVYILCTPAQCLPL